MIAVRVPLFLVVALVISSTACADRPPVAPLVERSPDGSPPSMLRADRPGVEGRFLRIADGLPTFAGMGLDPSDNARAFVYVTSRADLPQALAAVRPLVADLARKNHMPAAPSVSGVLVRFGFADLAAWRDVVSNHADLPGLNIWAIDYRQNRVYVGVDGEQQVPAVRSALEAHGIPAEALDVRTSSPPVLTASLQDRFPAAVPGIKISSSAWGCSLGINVYSPTGARAFFTASHCTPTWLGPDGTPFYQPTSNFAAIGSESSDPPGLLGTGTNGCPIDHYCRWSDVAAVAYHSSAAWKFSWIARPSSGITFGEYTPIVGVADEPYQGQWVARVGMTSGYAYGTVEYPTAGVTDIHGGRRGAILGATMVTGASAGEGDSGGPVFVDPMVYAPPGQTWIAGVEFARNTASTAFFYNSLENIYADHGYGWIVSGVTVRLTGPTSIAFPNAYTWTATAMGGAPLTYQWERSINGTVWEPVGANSSTYTETISSIVPGISSSFYLRVTASAGTEPGRSARSDALQVLVYRPK